MKTLILVPIFLLTILSNIFSQNFKIENGTLLLVEIVVYNKTTGGFMTNIRYVKSKDSYSNAEDLGTELFFGGSRLNQEQYSELDSLLSITRNTKYPRVLKRFNRLEYKLADKYLLKDDLMECMKEKYSDQIILVKWIKFTSEYVFIPCKKDSETDRLHPCVVPYFQKILYPIHCAKKSISFP